MPYRRLPNTDQARIRALRAAVDQGELVGFVDLPYSFKLKNEAAILLAQMEQAVQEYQVAMTQQVSSAKEYASSLKMARLYVSHFIQVLNMCVLRNEIRKEMKSLYQLPMDNYALPDLSTEAAVAKWGKNVITGEQNRMKKGGSPIYNPSVAKVSVFYETFMDAKVAQKVLQNNTKRAMAKLDNLHEKVDAVILEIWNQVEEHFKDLLPEEKRNQCQRFGLCYYFRKGEKEKMETND